VIGIEIGIAIEIDLPVVEAHPSPDPLVQFPDFGEVHSDHVVVRSKKKSLTESRRHGDA